MLNGLRNPLEMGLTSPLVQPGAPVLPPVLDLIGSTSERGHLIYVPLPPGYVDTRQTYVAPERISVTITTPSVDGTANPTTITTTLRTGFRANVNLLEDRLEIWMAQRIPQSATQVLVNIAADAIRNSGVFAGAVSGLITNNSTEEPSPTFHMIGVVGGEDDLRVAHSIVEGQMAVEAYGWHFGGAGVVRFTFGSGNGAPVRYAMEETNSRYRDKALITPEKWAENGNGGIGVFSSGLFDFATLPDGEVEITATYFAKVGGAAAQRSITWTVVNNSGGTYSERIRYVDAAAGSDANDGLTEATAYATLEHACLQAGSVNGGASATDIPIVRLVGSGDPANPATYEFYNGSGTGDAVPGQTDTWLTVEAAPGYDHTDTWLVNYTGVDLGWAPRIRRLHIKGLGWDIADNATTDAISSRALVNNNQSIYPPDTNPAAIWFEKIDSFHGNGRVGHIVEGGAGNVIGNSFSKKTLAFFTQYTVRDMGRRGHQSPAFDVMRDVLFERVQKDVLKEPECIVGFKAVDNVVAPEFLPLANVVGTPVAGDVITGVLSPGSVTVAEYIPSPGTLSAVILQAGDDSYTMKPDDSKTHSAVTVSDATGFQVGETVNGKTLYRIDGNILRFENSTGLAVNDTVTGDTSAASSTITAISNGEQSLFFSISGARATAAPPHPDGLQVQDFVEQRLFLSNISGSFQINEEVTAPRSGGGNDIAGVVRVIRPDGVEVAGTNQWDLVTTGSTVTGGTTGTTATYESREYADNDRNLMLYSGVFERCDGAILFVENGARSVALINIVGIHVVGRNDTSGAAAFNIGNTDDFALVHCTFPNRQGRSVRNLNNDDTIYDLTVQGSLDQTYAYNVFAYATSQSTAQGAPGDINCGPELTDYFGNHMIMEREDNHIRQVTQGDPLFLEDLGVLADYDETATYRLAPDDNSPLFGRLPAGARTVKYDVFGTERPNDGTGAAGALEKWPGVARGVPGAVAVEPPGMPDVVPDAIALDQWTLTDTGVGGQLRLEVLELPSGNLGGDVTALEYQVDGGAAVALADPLIGTHLISGLTDEQAVSVTIVASNAEGPGPAGDAKVRTPTTAPAVISAPVIEDDFFDTTGTPTLYEGALITPPTDPMFVAIMTASGSINPDINQVNSVTIGTAARPAGTGTALTLVGFEKLSRAFVAIYRLPDPSAIPQTVQVEYAIAPRGMRAVVLSMAGASGLVGAVGEQEPNTAPITTMRTSVTTQHAQSLILYAMCKLGGEAGDAMAVSGATELVTGTTGAATASSDSTITVAFEQAPGAAEYDCVVTSTNASQMRGIAVEVRS